MKYSQQIVLKNGKTAVLRNGVASDGSTVFDNFNLTHAETDFLLSYPDENSFDPEKEGQFLEQKAASANEIEIIAFVDGKVAGTAGIVYWIAASASAGVIFGCLLMMLLISVFVLTLSCALGWVVAKISLKLKNKSFITVIISLAFFGGYYFFYFKAQTLIQSLLANAADYAAKIKGAAYPLYLFGKVGTGDWLAMLMVSAVVIALFAIVWALVSRSFLKIATSSGKTEKRVYKEKATKPKSISRALLGKEFSRFLSSPLYMLNCGLGILLLPIAGAALAWKGGTVISVLNDVFGAREGCTPLILCALICVLASMNDMAVPSVSLEGKTFWLVQSLPVTPWQVLRAKLGVQLLLTGVPALVCFVCLIFIYPYSPLEILLTAFTYAKRLKALHNKMLTQIADEQRHTSRLRIGITHSSENNTINEILAKYVNQFPRTTITIITETINNLYEMLENYELDLAIVEGKRLSPKLNYFMLDTDYLVCVLNNENPLCKHSMVTVNELKKENMILRLPTSATRRLFEATLISINETIENFNVALEVDNVATIKELVGKNLGISILPRSVCISDVKKGKISVLPIENLSMMREVNIAYNKDFTRVEILKEMVQLYQSTVSKN